MRVLFLDKNPLFPFIILLLQHISYNHSKKGILSNGTSLLIEYETIAKLFCL